VKRRKFLALAAIAGTSCCSRPSGPTSGRRVLSELETHTLEAWVECLIPSDQDPGAKDAGVVRFIDNQLADRLRRKRQPWRTALEAIHRASVLLHSKPFYELDSKLQSDLLGRMEEGRAPKEAFPEDGGRAAFELVLSFAMMGFYGSPRHGGNQDYASWRMLGIPLVPIRGRRHREEVAPVEKEKANAPARMGAI
jgi:gluconate 2-dehydrogenase gamma chain